MYAPIITTIKRDKASGRATHTTANFADQPAKMARHYEWEGMGAEHAHLEACRKTLLCTYPDGVFVPARLDENRMIWVCVSGELGTDGRGHRGVIALTREGRVPA